MELKNYFKSGTHLSGVYFGTIQNIVRCGNAQGWKHSLEAQIGIWKDPSQRPHAYPTPAKVPVGHRPAKSGLSLCLPGVSPPCSGSDHGGLHECVTYLSMSINRLCPKAHITWRTETITWISWSYACFCQLPENQGKHLMSFLASRILMIALFLRFSHHRLLTDHNALTTPERLRREQVFTSEDRNYFCEKELPANYGLRKKFSHRLYEDKQRKPKP